MSRAEAIRRAALVALAVVVLVAGVVVVRRALSGGDTYRITAYFDRAVSVFESSDVRVLGLPAGEVDEVTIDGDRVRVDMAIDADIRIPANATAQIVPQSLIGERYVQISPAHRAGEPALEDGAVIERTIIPVEPDEALASLKDFVDSLDPEGLGTLVGNLEEDLRGNGGALNDALGSLSQLVQTFAEEDDTLLRLVDSFDRLTATLVTREAQLGEIIDAFGAASTVLAEERESIEALVAGLAELSRDGLELVGTHAGALRRDIETLAEAAATIDANLASVTQLLASGPLLVDGIIGAYNPQLRAMDLRNNFTPLVTDALALLGIDLCLPILQECPVEGQSAIRPIEAAVDAPPATPVSALVELLGAPTDPPEPRPGWTQRVGRTLGDVTRSLLGVGE